MSTRRNRKLASDLAVFMRLYGRKGRGGSGDPNDRHYDRQLEKRVKLMPPDELDRLLHDDPDESSLIH